MFQMKSNDPHVNLPLIDVVQNILKNIGLNYIWISQNFASKPWLIDNVKQVLCDQFYQYWNSCKSNSSKGFYYNMYKLTPCLENYLLSLPLNRRIFITHIRTCNHRLPIETGRWCNINREERLCTLCKNSIGDEYHFILECPYFNKYETPWYQNIIVIIHHLVNFCW